MSNNGDLVFYFTEEICTIIIKQRCGSQIKLHIMLYASMSFRVVLYRFIYYEIVSYFFPLHAVNGV